MNKVPICEDEVKLSSRDLLATSQDSQGSIESGPRLVSPFTKNITSTCNIQDTGRSLLLPKTEGGATFHSLSANQVLNYSSIEVVLRGY